VQRGDSDAGRQREQHQRRDADREQRRHGDDGQQQGRRAALPSAFPRGEEDRRTEEDQQQAGRWRQEHACADGDDHQIDGDPVAEYVAARFGSHLLASVSSILFL
jgi:hypothetical protein